MIASLARFASTEDQGKYQAEPAHTAFVEACKELWSKVVVYDSIPISKK